jgi:AraC-like DNA-binding protein
METPDQVSSFISRAASDHRMKPHHMALYMALCHSWIMNRFQQHYNVSRRQLKKLSRIQSNSTYHKTISELTSMGYINYRPSYHPKQGSKVSLIVPVQSQVGNIKTDNV